MASGNIPKPIEDVVSKKESGTISANGSADITITQTGSGILLLTIFGQNIERGYILPFYMVNQYAYSVGTVLLDYSYQTQSQAVTITRNANVITINNGSSVSVTYKAVVISAYRGS